MAECSLLPREVEQRLEEFMKAGKTGRVEFDIRDGQMVGARFVDAVSVNQGGRVER